MIRLNYSECGGDNSWYLFVEGRQTAFDTNYSGPEGKSDLTNEGEKVYTLELEGLHFSYSIFG